MEISRKRFGRKCICCLLCCDAAMLSALNRGSLVFSLVHWLRDRPRTCRVATDQGIRRDRLSPLTRRKAGRPSCKVCNFSERETIRHSWSEIHSRSQHARYHNAYRIIYKPQKWLQKHSIFDRREPQLWLCSSVCYVYVCVWFIALWMVDVIST